MKKIFFVFLLIFFYFPSSYTLSPAIKEYPTSSEFLKAEGNICESVTDGCNTVSISNGELWAMTKMYCENIYGEKWHEKWSCLKYIDAYDYGLDDAIMCTMQYEPVCAEVQVQCIKVPCFPIQQTFWNSCSAGKSKILYIWECDSYVDISLYNKYKKSQNEIKLKLEKVSIVILIKANELIDTLILSTKMLKIADCVIRQRITKYVFLKNLVQEEISKRY